MENPQLSWYSSLGANGYEYCYDTSDNDQCDSNWQPAVAGSGFQSSGGVTTVLLIQLELETQYYWQVRATNSFGSLEADAGEWWQFVTGELTYYSTYFPGDYRLALGLLRSLRSQPGAAFELSWIIPH